MPELSSEMIAACRSYADRFGVSEKIHSDDLLFWSTSANVEHYFAGGHKAALTIKDIVGRLRSLPRPFEFLDFASGYGRVARHMKNVMPEAILTASDIHPAAVEFVRSMGIAAVPSARVPEEFDPGQKFDVICAISLFTHLPRDTWIGWAQSLCRFLKPGGVLVFTTCGRAILPIPELKAMSITSESVPPDGFLYLPVSDQSDLSLYEYGTAIALFEFVFRETLDAGLRIVWFQEAGFENQDLVVLTQPDANFHAFRAFVRSRSSGLGRIWNLLTGS
jgi:SAM-dependent methyltransferase